MRGWSFAPRRIFVAGLLVTLPGVVAAYVLYIAFTYLDGIFEPLVQRALHRSVPGVGLVALVTLVFLVGLIASNLFGARLLRGVAGGLERIPLFSPVYKAMRDISQVFLGDKASAFRQVALLEWPRPGTWTIVFVMADRTRFAEDKLGGELVTVFLPTTPNPTTGFVQLVPRSALTPLDISVEQALKLFLSGGAAAAQWPAAAAAAAAAAAPRAK